MKRIMTFILTLSVSIPAAFAVVWGELDGEGHPYVGLLVFDTEGVPSHRCSGTLLSPTVMLTAGHCTFGTSGGRVWFESNDEDAIRNSGYPFGGGIEFSEIHTHPEYIDNLFFLFDVGVVILSEPVVLAEYAVLVDVGTLDYLAVKRGQKDRYFNPVGYGIQGIVPNPNTVQSDLVRYTGEVMLIDVKGTQGIPAGISFIMTSHPGAKISGGTCFGDSGGPILMEGTNVIAGVNSFGINLNCVGTGGAYRVDTVDDQDFIYSFLN